MVTHSIRVIFILLFTASLFISNADSRSFENITAQLQLKVIWNGPGEGNQGYAVFRKTFDLVDFDEPIIHIVADTEYILMNKRTKGRNQKLHVDTVPWKAINLITFRVILLRQP